MIKPINIRLDTMTFNALVAGPENGEPVLLLHGWPEFSDCWRPIMQQLATAGYRALAVDQRGYSPAARPEAITDYAIDLLVADALGFAEQQGWACFHLVAHDWGGVVAWALAGAHSDRLRSLAVLATPHPVALAEESTADKAQYHRLDYVRFFRQPGGVAEMALLADGAARLRASYGGHVPVDLVDANIARLSRPGALTATLNWYRAPDDSLAVPAGRISTPTLYLWGDQDAALGEGAAKRTAAFVDAPYRFHILKGASHWLPEQMPDEIGGLLLEHLSKVNHKPVS